MFGLLSFSFAQSGEIFADKSRLNVDGWEIVMPQISIDEKTGLTWVKYNYPGGGYQSYPLQPGEKITWRWIKTGVEGFNETPGGYSVEDTDAILNWWSNKGEGHFIVENGQWVPTTKSPPPLPQVGTKDPGPGPGPGNRPMGPSDIAKEAKRLLRIVKSLPPGKDRDQALLDYYEFCNNQGRKP
jgi:hypothetical protein